METFGPVVMCKLVLDRVTRQPVGTAFVQFEDASGAKASVTAAAAVSVTVVAGQGSS